MQNLRWYFKEGLTKELNETNSALFVPFQDFVDNVQKNKNNLKSKMRKKLQIFMENLVLEFNNTVKVTLNKSIGNSDEAERHRLSKMASLQLDGLIQKIDNFSSELQSLMNE